MMSPFVPPSSQELQALFTTLETFGAVDQHTPHSARGPGSPAFQHLNDSHHHQHHGRKHKSVKGEDKQARQERRQQRKERKAERDRAASPQASFVPPSPQQGSFMPHSPRLLPSHAQLGSHSYHPMMHGMGTVNGDGLGAGGTWPLVHSTSPGLAPSFPTPGLNAEYAAPPKTVSPHSPRLHARHGRQHDHKESSSKKKQSAQSPVLGPQSWEAHEDLKQELVERQQQLMLAQKQLSETLDKVTSLSMPRDVSYFGETRTPHAKPSPTMTYADAQHMYPGANAATMVQVTDSDIRLLAVIMFTLCFVGNHVDMRIAVYCSEHLTGAWHAVCSRR